MRWITFFILAYLAVGLQSGIARAAAIGSAPPNLVLLAMVFITLNAPRDAALLAAFILGLMQDLASQGAIGLYAFSYGLAALLIVSIQQAVYRRHPLTQFSMVLLGGIVTAIVLSLHGWLHPPPAGRFIDADPHAHLMRMAVMPRFYTALYSALLAPIVIGILERVKAPFRLHTNRRNTKFS